MTKEEKLIREYFEPIDNINGNETIEVLPLTLVDMLLEYESKVLKLHKHIVGKCLCCNEVKELTHCEECGNDIGN